VTRIAVAAEVLTQVQSLIDERTVDDADRAAAIQLVDVDSDDTATADAVRGRGSGVGRWPRSPTAASR
jgi:hypothetical protein